MTQHPLPLSNLTLYETDFYAWTQQQAALLRQHQWTEVDILHLIEEIEALGKQQQQELRNRLSVLLGHLLKWEHQPGKRSRSWLVTLRIQRLDINDLLDDNPSLKPYLDEVLATTYRKGIERAVVETDLPRSAFPSECPYSLEEVLGDRFYSGIPSDLTHE
jgi:hypothetical protein